MRQNQKGFTLIEILVVIGILAVLFAIALVAINPARQFSQANNTKRRSDVNALLNAIHQYAADNKGALPSAITTSVLTIGNAVGQTDVCAAVVTKYIAALPRDPLVTGGDVTDCVASYTTNYTVVKSATDNRITVAAPGAELGDTIAVTR